MIRAVCFDFDGTLLRDDHVDGVVRRVAGVLSPRYGVDAEVLAHANGRAWREYWPSVGDHWTRGELSSAEIALEVWRRAFAALGVDDVEAAEAAVALHAEFEGAAYALYPEARDVLAELRARGILIAIVTNGPSELQRAKLAAVSLEGDVDVIVVSGEHGVHKPDPAIFTIVLDELGVDAGEALFVGDNQVADVRGSRDAGLVSVWINRTGAEPVSQPHAVVTHLRGVLGLL